MKRLCFPLKPRSRIAIEHIGSMRLLGHVLSRGAADLDQRLRQAPHSQPSECAAPRQCCVHQAARGPRVLHEVHLHGVQVKVLRTVHGQSPAKEKRNLLAENQLTASGVVH